MRSRELIGLGVVWLLLACGAEQPAAADETFDRVSFSIQRTREVDNDWLIATIGVTRENEDPAALAAAVNEDMHWALAIAKAEPRVEVRSGGYRTHPISDPKQRRIRTWRGGQDLVIESGDSEALSALLGKLQARLQLRGMQQGVSRALREKVEEELLVELLDAYAMRAERIAKHMGARGHKLVDLRFDGSGAPGPMPMHQLRSFAGESLAAPPPPIEGGTSTLRAGASATIKLER